MSTNILYVFLEYIDHLFSPSVYTCFSVFCVCVLPPVWFLRMVTHLHCSTLASLLLDPNTVLGPMNLPMKQNQTAPTISTFTS